MRVNAFRPSLKFCSVIMNLSLIGKRKVHIVFSYPFVFCSHRHRRTETEEDEELLSLAKKSTSVLTRFEESPTCKSV